MFCSSLHVHNQLSMIERCSGQSQTPPLKHISLQEGSGKMETVPRGQEQTRHLGRKGMVLLVSRASRRLVLHQAPNFLRASPCT